MGIVAGEIQVLCVYPHEIRRGDYVQRSRYRSIKVTTIKPLGLVWRVAGVSSDIGANVIYPERDKKVKVVRGFPVDKLPEHDDAPSLRLALAQLAEDEAEVER